ncbi:hypothetical protein Tco_0726336 [Tanacetum coccineum]|uniref:Uncharacterized protein n=1 Tax=Tanacetum coccineum TaxID=301880 RepID=A0ABQ4YFY2_9ASTR
MLMLQMKRIKEIRQSNTNTDLDGRDKVMTDVEDTHVTLTPVNPDGQQQSSSVSSGFVSNMLNPNQDTAIMEHPSLHKSIALQHRFLSSFKTNDPPINDSWQLLHIREMSLLLQIAFLETIYDGMKKSSRNKEGSPSIHAVAANLSELELKKILINKMETNNSINRSDIQRQLYKDLVEAYEADKILLDTYGDTVIIKRPRDGADDDDEPCRNRMGVGDVVHSTDVFKGPADQEFETGVQDENKAERRGSHFLIGFNKTYETTASPDHAMEYVCPCRYENCAKNVQTLTPELLAGQHLSDERHCKSYLLTGIFFTTVSSINSQGRRVIPFHHFIKTTGILRGWCVQAEIQRLSNTTNLPSGESRLGQRNKERQLPMIANLHRGISMGRLFKKTDITVTKVEIVEWHDL